MEKLENNKNITAILVDDHSMFRSGIKRLLEETAGVDVIGETGSGNKAIRLFKEKQPELFILDISMPDMDGVDICKQAIAINPNAKILILTMHSEELFAVRALKAGATGYISKTATLEELRQAVKTVARGELYVSNAHTSSVISQLLKMRGHNTQLDLLSDREIQVVSLVAKGKKLKEIANTLGLSISTISNYRYRAMQKLSLRNNTDLIEFAHQNKLI